MSKNSWKRILRVKFLNAGRDDLQQRVNNSDSLARFINIHSSDKPYFLYSISKETPKYYKNTKLAVRLLGLMFCGKKSMVCRSCGELSLTLTEHILLFCISNEEFRNKLWKKCLIDLELSFSILLYLYHQPDRLMVFFLAVLTSWKMTLILRIV